MSFILKIYAFNPFYFKSRRFLDQVYSISPEQEVEYEKTEEKTNGVCTQNQKSSLSEDEQKL